MAYDGSIIIETKVDKNGIKKGKGDITKEMNGLSDVFGKLGKKILIAFSAKALVDFSKKAMQLASDLEEVQNVVDVAFGDMSYKIEQFSKTSIEQLGISELSAKRTASTYMAMGKGMGIAEESASNMAIELTRLSADLASFYNISQERADVVLKSVYTGETETLKQLGIVMTEVNLKQFALSKGITKSIDDMTQSEKTILRYNYVMQQTALAQGDFARTSQNWANQLRILQETWKNFMTTVGQGLIKILTPLLQLLNLIVGAINKLANAIASLFGGSTKQANEQAESIQASVDNEENLADAIKDTNKESKKLLASFDTIEKLSSSSNGNLLGAEVSSGLYVENVELTTNINEEMSKAEPYLERMRNAIGGVKDSFTDLWGNITSIFSAIWNHPLVVAIREALFTTFMEVLTRAVESLAYVITGVNWVGSGFLDILAGLLTFDGERIAKGFKKVGEGLWNISYAIASLVGGEDAVSWLKRFKENIEKVGLKEAIGIAYEEAKEEAGKKLDEIYEKIETTFSEENLEETFSNLGEKFGEAILNMKKFWENDFMPFWNEKILPLFSKEKWEEMCNNIGEAFKSLFKKETWENLGKQCANGIIKGINGLIDAWQAIMNVVVTVVNAFIDGYNSIALASDGMLKPIPQSKKMVKKDLSGYHIPELAKGAVIPPNKEFMAILGDQKSGVNIETPLATMVQAFKQAISETGGTGDLNADITLEIDGEKLYNQQQRIKIRRGTRLVTGGAY